MPLALALTLLAAEPLPPAADDIVVTAPCRLTARQLRPALKVYRSGRTRRAPNSALFFETDTDARRAGLTVSSLRLLAGGRSLAISADAQGRFTLSGLSDDKWAIVGPCHDGALPISPLVLSPGTNEADRRLGDMRLQCDVGWAIAEQQVSLAAGAFRRVAGTCKGTRAALHAGSPRPIARADVVTGAVMRPVRVSADGLRYSVPLGDGKMPDSAHVRFRFR